MSPGMVSITKFLYRSVEGKVKAAEGIRAGVVHAKLLHGEYRGSDLGLLLTEAADMAVKDDVEEHLYILKGITHTFDQQVKLSAGSLYMYYLTNFILLDNAVSRGD